MSQFDLDAPVSSQPLSMRLRNILAARRIQTLRDAARRIKGKKGFYYDHGVIGRKQRIQNMGDTSARELRRAILQAMASDISTREGEGK